MSSIAGGSPAWSSWLPRTKVSSTAPDATPNDAPAGDKVEKFGIAFTLGGTYRKAPVTGGGKAGAVLSLTGDHTVYPIQANAVLPGWIRTELTESARTHVPGLNERVIARTAAGRWGEPPDLAGIAVFLAGAGSDFVTGTAIPVDGGYSIAA